MELSRWVYLTQAFLILLIAPAMAADWPPINPSELNMTREPLAPEAPAIYVFRQVDRDDSAGHEYNYVRIKVLKDEGRKYANVELQYVKGSADIRDIKARTIKPDGSILNFDGRVYDQTVVKTKGVRFLARTFTLPDVQVGSIIEYSYVYSWLWPQLLAYDSHWILSEDLFTRHAVFSLTPARMWTLRWSWKDLPKGTTPPHGEKGAIRLDVQNIPAFESEDYMPPANELKSRVDFIYTSILDKDPVQYWKKVNKYFYENTETFLSKHKAIDEAIPRIVNLTDSPEEKLQKIYARVQQIRNLSFEDEKTAQEVKRENLKSIKSVEDVWKQGYGNGEDIDLLYLALVRSTGFEAYSILVSRRDQYLFNPELPNSSRLNDTVVLVKLNGKDLYLDPGTAFAPFGLLPWPETAVKGLKLDKDGGGWVTTRSPDSATSRTERRAELTLNEDGSMEGKLRVTFTGLEALSMRIEERSEDSTGRKQFLEKQVKTWVPANIEVTLTNEPDWKSSSQPLVAELNLKAQGWASNIGRREFIPFGLFGGTETHVFEQETRVHPIYLSFPFQQSDEIIISFPSGWQVSALPPTQIQDGHWTLYSCKADKENGKIHLNRKLSVDFVILDQKYYPLLRKVFQAVRTGDEEQIVLQKENMEAGK